MLDDLIHEPMLLIDDEADNASINTKKDKLDPTKTNKVIRQLCNAFNNATYVGFIRHLLMYLLILPLVMRWLMLICSRTFHLCITNSI